MTSEQETLHRRAKESIAAAKLLYQEESAGQIERAEQFIEVACKLIGHPQDTSNQP